MSQDVVRRIEVNIRNRSTPLGTMEHGMVCGTNSALMINALHMMRSFFHMDKNGDSSTANKPLTGKNRTWKTV